MSAVYARPLPTVSQPTVSQPTVCNFVRLASSLLLMVGPVAAVTNKK